VSPGFSLRTAPRPKPDRARQDVDRDSRADAGLSRADRGPDLSAVRAAAEAAGPAVCWRRRPVPDRRDRLRALVSSPERIRPGHQSTAW